LCREKMGGRDPTSAGQAQRPEGRERKRDILEGATFAGWAETKTTGKKRGKDGRNKKKLKPGGGEGGKDCSKAESNAEVGTTSPTEIQKTRRD